MRLFPVSAMYRLPCPSMVTPAGALRTKPAIGVGVVPPLPFATEAVTIVVCAELLSAPLMTGTSTIWLLPVSAMITLPTPSTATPSGFLSPLPIETGVEVGVAK